MTIVELLEQIQVALASGISEDAEYRFGQVGEDLVEPDGTRWSWWGGEWKRTEPRVAR